MNILLINHYAGSSEHGMEFRPFYLSKEWVRMGHSVKIVAASYSHIRARQPELGGFSTLNELIDGVSYRWYYSPAYKGNGVGRILNMFYFLFALWRDAKKLASDFKPDLVIASSTYPMDIWPAKLISKLSGAKLIFEVHDLWPLSPMELGNMSRWHPFIMLVQFAEDFAYRYSNKVVCMLPKALDYMISRGLHKEKFVYIPNGIATEEWSEVGSLPVDLVKCIADIKSAGLPIVGYSGTHGVANALDLLLDASKYLHDEAHVILIGTGPDRDRLLARVNEEKLVNVHMFPSIPKNAIPAFLLEIDIAYIGSYQNSLYRFGISPNKLMDYMMAEKPIVMAISAGNDPVAEARCGVTVAPGNPEEVAVGVRTLLKLSDKDRFEMGQRGRHFITSNQTYVVLAQRFLEGVLSISSVQGDGA